MPDSKTKHLFTKRVEQRSWDWALFTWCNKKTSINLKILCLLMTPHTDCITHLRIFRDLTSFNRRHECCSITYQNIPLGFYECLGFYTSLRNIHFHTVHFSILVFFKEKKFRVLLILLAVSHIDIRFTVLGRS